MASPLAVPEPWNLVAESYNEIVVPLFEAFATRGIELLELGSGARVLDVACGPGTASALLARAGHEVDAIDFSEAMLAELGRKLAPGGLLTDLAIRPQHMDGQNLSFSPNRFDGALSMFGLMFFPDRARGFAELHRVLKPGARAAVSSWLPLSRTPAMQWAFAGFASVTPPPPKDAPQREPILEDPEVFAAEMRAAGFQDVRVEHSSQPFQVATVEQFWDGMVRSNAAVALFKARSGDGWPELSAKVLAKLKETAPADLSNLTLDAWIGSGRK
jgi:SAM-dependent methyltransferase